MTVHRYCLLGLPRTGSQYIAEMLSKTVSSLDLEEPLTVSDNLSTIISKNNLILKVPHIGFNSIEEQIEHTLSCLDNASLNQSLTMRLFLIDRIEPHISDIIDRLIKLNFKFLIIRRENAEHHFLSYLIARKTNIWNSKVNKNQPYHPNTQFEIDNLNDLVWLRDQRKVFDTVLTKLNINCEIIRYEHAVTDLERALGTTINTNISLKKQIPSDPYDLIANPLEVKDFITKLIT